MLDSFLKQTKPMLFRRKELIPGADNFDRIFYLNQGFIRLYTISREGSELTLHIFRPSSIFPILWNKSLDPTKYFFETLTPVEVYSIEKDKLLKLASYEPSTSLEIIQQLSSFSESAIKKLEFKIFSDAYQQIIATLLNLVECFGKKDNGTLVISYWFTHQDIASLTGLSRERVTIEINKLLNKNLISYSKHFISIPKIKLLKSEIE